MDSKQIEKELAPFIDACASKGFPIEKISLKEAYPGVDGTSYNLQVKAAWTAGKGYWQAIDFLFDVLFETTSVELRTNIFSIQILDLTENGSFEPAPIDSVVPKRA